MSGSVQTIQKGLGNLGKLLTQVVEVGFPEGKSDPETIGLAQLLEYRGSQDVLPDSALPPSWRVFHETHPRGPYEGWAFMAKTKADVDVEAPDEITEIVVRALANPSFNVTAAMRELGQKYAERMKQKIREIVEPPIQESTIERRERRPGSQGGTKPLIDTGEFINEVTSRVTGDISDS